jgi:hypothetical protein
MTIKRFASWAHGNTAVSENPDLASRRQGFGATFVIPADTGQWIHLPVPSPVLEEDARATLDQVLVSFDARTTSSLEHVHVWDGGGRIAAHENLGLKGDHTAIGSDNIFKVGRPDIFFGIGISVFFAGGELDSEVFIPGFGGDFLHDIPS